MTIMDLKELLPKSKEFFLMIVDDLSSKLNSLADKLKGDVKQIQLSFDDYDKIKKLNETFLQLDDIIAIA